MRRAGDRLRQIALRLCPDDVTRRVVDPIVADLQFEHAEALARGDRRRARLARARAVVAIVRVVLVVDRKAWRVAAWAVVATGALTAPHVAVALVALPVVMPTGVAIGVLAACEVRLRANAT
jgi:hypothetical protein